MTETPPLHDDRATDEAIDWVIRLAEEPDDPELRAHFESWHAAAPENREAWRHANHVSDLVGQSRNIAFLEPPAARPPDRLASSRRHRRRWPTFAAAAIAASLALAVTPTLLLRLHADHRTGTAERRTVALEDGSSIRLGPESAVSVTFAHGTRDVRLLSGEAYFEVARDEKRPFRVLTDQAMTTVLGTGFDVRLGGNSTDVSVRHGRVRVTSTGSVAAKRELTAGQWAAVKNGRLSSGDGAASLVGSWSNGTLAVVDRPVAEVIADIRRSYHGVIIVDDDRLASRSASGSFDLADPAGAIVALVRPHGATVRQITPWIILVSRD
ncbi:FecR family protein [Sphingomonas colocasiae]|uniref:FecR family protein n=1 Tax=Sphingomonas colocasiae TaxID=1848973 RepID=A0ABS7PNC4_9SPHN|nr:FecR family protein [Sphingomonas colocasiae]MBY8822804.1 FecR family protein [Sphingomonas colocasiae]